MHEPLHVLWPLIVPRILRPCYREAALGPFPSWFNEQPFEGGLTIVAVGPHIAQVPFLVSCLRVIKARIHRAVERAGHRRSVVPLQKIQRGPSREGEIKVVMRN